MTKTAANNEPLRVDDREAREAVSSEEPLHKILAFLVGEFARKESRQCTGIDLLYAPGHGYRDECIREWTREDDTEFFDGRPNIERLALLILEIAEDEVDAKDIGRHRFVVRTRQYLGHRQTMSFSLSPADVGNSDKEKEDQMTKSKDKKINDNENGDGTGDTRARKQLLARVAAHVAGSVVAAPSKRATSSEAIAEISVDIAEAILQRVGL